MPRLTLFIDTGTKSCSYDINDYKSVTVFGPEGRTETVNASREEFCEAARRVFIDIMKDIIEMSKDIDEELLEEYNRIIEEERERRIQNNYRE